MAKVQVSLSRKRLATPRAAAVAGILFALFYGTSQVLIRLSALANLNASSVWLDTNSRMILLALNLRLTPGSLFYGSSA
jgi:hypothetical protein